MKKQGKTVRFILWKGLTAGVLVTLLTSTLLPYSFAVRAEDGTSENTTPVETIQTDNSSSHEESTPPGEDGDDGTPGEDGEPAEEPTDPSAGESENTDTVIETGDATAVVDVDNIVNANGTAAGDPCTTECGTDTATSSSHGLGGTGLEVDSQNTASVGSGADIDALSGLNQVEENTANIYIKTGDVDVFADIANYINTNIIGSDRIEVINIYDATGGVLDFSGFGQVLSETAAETLAMPAMDYTHANTTNDALVENDLQIDAVSGANTISAVDGNVVIETGDVDVRASLFNAVNTNIIGNNWKFKVINIYSDWIGDIILPALQAKNASVGCGGCVDYLLSQTNNDANISNTINMDLDSGTNRAEADNGVAAILTGDADGSASIYNLANANIIGDDWFYTTFNVNGWWHGSVYNTTPSVIRSDIDSNHIIAGTLGSPDASAQPTAPSTTPDYSSWYDTYGITSYATNTAQLTNNIGINGVSGGNLATTQNGNAGILTGDVRARAAITNLVNTTIIGNNWQFILINVFGNWQGNLHYGMPDLALSEVAVPDVQPIWKEQNVTYLLSYTNGGDAPAQNVVIRDSFDPLQLSVTQANGGTLGGGTIEWHLGTLNPGETGVKSYTARVVAGNDSHEGYIFNTASVTNNNSDRDLSNNTTGGVITLAAMPLPGGGGSWSGGSGWWDAQFTLKKQANKQVARPGDSVTYKVVLRNIASEHAYSVGVSDAMKNAAGEQLSVSGWNLGLVYSHEEITLDYTTQLPASLAPGQYTNEVVVYAKNRYGQELPVTKAHHVLTVLPPYETLSALGFWGDLMSSEQPTSTPSDTVTTGNPTITRTGGQGTSPDDDPLVLGALFSMDDGKPGSPVDAASLTGNSSAFHTDTSRLAIALVLVIVASILYYVVRKMQEPLSSDKLKV